MIAVVKEKNNEDYFVALFVSMEEAQFWIASRVSLGVKFKIKKF